MTGTIAADRLDVSAATRPGAGIGDWSDRLSAISASAAVAIWTAAVLLGGGAASDGRKERSQPDASAGAGLAASETLFAGYVGYPYTHPSDLRFLNPAARTDLTVKGVQWEGKPFKTPIYYGLRAAYWGSLPFGMMLDFTHSKAIAIPAQTVIFTGERNGAPAPGPATIRDTFKHMEFSHGHNMLTSNLLWRFLPATAPVVPYIGAGAGANLPHTEVQFHGEPDRTYEYQFTGAIGQAIVGVEVRLPFASVFIEYKFTAARYEAPLTGRDSRLSYGPDDFWTQLVDWWKGRKPKYGTVSTTLVSHQVIGGVGYRRPGVAAAGGG